jgi:hypothetical protein
MAINGQINSITNQTAFFGPILLGSGNPTSGFAPLKGESFVITMTGFSSSMPLVHPTVPASINPANSTFSPPEFPAAFKVNDVSLNLARVGQPFYRTQLFK